MKGRFLFLFEEPGQSRVREMDDVEGVQSFVKEIQQAESQECCRIECRSSAWVAADTRPLAHCTPTRGAVVGGRLPSG